MHTPQVEEQEEKRLLCSIMHDYFTALGGLLALGSCAANFPHNCYHSARPDIVNSACAILSSWSRKRKPRRLAGTFVRTACACAVQCQRTRQLGRSSAEGPARASRFHMLDPAKNRSGNTPARFMLMPASPLYFWGEAEHSRISFARCLTTLFFCGSSPCSSVFSPPSCFCLQPLQQLPMNSTNLMWLNSLAATLRRRYLAWKRADQSTVKSLA